MKKFLLVLVFLTFYPLVNYAGLYDEVKEKIDANKQVIDSSKGKNIVAFIGSTGSGKSTALNYINNVPLIYDELQELIHYDDSSISEEIFKIVHGGISGTDAPKYIDNAYTETRMYDFPGWNDNRGLSHEIVSAAFVKNIIEQADKYKLVFVVKHGTINTDRGRPLLDLSASVKKVFANQVLSNIAGVVVTETRQANPVNMFNNIKAKTDFENISAFKENVFWPFAGHLMDQENQKNNILDGIINLTFSQPCHPEEHQELNDSINIGELLSHEAKNKLLELFSEHHKQIFIDEYSYYENHSISDPITIEDVEKNSDLLMHIGNINNMQNTRIGSAIKNSSFITLLKPLAREAYQKSYQVLLENISAKTESIKRTLEIKKIEIYWTEKLNKAEKQRLEDIRNIEIEKQQVLAEKQKELEDAQGKIVNLTDTIHQNQLEIQKLQNEIDRLRSNRLTAKRI